ncbi:zf-HC2 domain-containing protein [Gulosibacter faecalis]|jgi:anti-sigma factor (TIGR02949 family)|uniref:Zf-HC2 domain-containing protein n=1 Tax=Gulosibacter faecalis TaxID=272240 RepID=A0ABW5UXP1_9MICO|nr:zf-HC2 domain-containing protein [Gulosibacter faecalis]
MTDCGCDKARQELEEYLRNEICSMDRDVIKEHLATCEDCSGEAHVNQMITQVVRRSCNEDVAPADLRDRVLASLRGDA